MCTPNETKIEFKLVQKVHAVNAVNVDDADDADDAKEKFHFVSGAAKEINEMWFNTIAHCTNRLDQSNKWPFALIEKFNRLQWRW